MLRTLLVSALIAGFGAAACTPAEQDAGAATETAVTESSTAPVATDWSARMAPDLDILRAEAAREIPDVAATAQAAARIGRVADELELTPGTDPALAEAAATFEHEAVSLAVLAPRQLEVADLKTLINDFLIKADAFQAEHPPS